MSLMCECGNWSMIGQSGNVRYEIVKNENIGKSRDTIVSYFSDSPLLSPQVNNLQGHWGTDYIST